MRVFLQKTVEALRTKGEIAGYLYGQDPDITTFDSAVPQGWVELAISRGFDDPARHVVTCYFKDSSVRIMPVTPRGLDILATLATYPPVGETA